MLIKCFYTNDKELCNIVLRGVNRKYEERKMYKTAKYRKITALAISIIMLIALFSFIPSNEKASASSGLFTPIVITGTLATSSDVFTTQITVDYDLEPVYHIFSIRTGTSGFTVAVTDEDSNVNNYLMNGSNASTQAGKLWAPLQNPENYSGEVTYDITVTARSFLNDCSFMLIIGEFYDVRDIIGNPLDPDFRTIPLARYTYFTSGSNSSIRDNLYGSYFVPTGNEEEHFTFVATGYGRDIISIQSQYDGIRFRVYDTTNGAFIADSGAPISDTYVNNTNLTYRYFTRYEDVGAWFIPGRAYRVEIFRDPTIQTSPGFINSTYAKYGNVWEPPSIPAYPVRIAIGAPRLISFNLSRNYTSSPTMTVTTSAFANRSIVVNDLPSSAQVTKIYITYSGTSLSNFGRFQYSPTSTAAFVQGSDRVDVFNVPYTYDSFGNRAGNSTWRVGYRSGFGTLTLTPGFTLQYHYEPGNP